MRRAGPPRRIRTVSGPLTGRLLLAGIVRLYSRRHRGTAPHTLHNVHITFPEQTEPADKQSVIEIAGVAKHENPSVRHTARAILIGDDGG
jgi:hypothetical protein